MQYLKKLCILCMVLFFCCPMTAFLQNDLLDTIFQPSKDLDQIINIGNNKNSVGNEIFIGSTTIDVSLWIIPACFKILSLSKDECEKWLYKRAYSQCVQLPATSISEDQCVPSWGVRGNVAYGPKTIEVPPLLVRVTQTLLRLTIALSIPMIIRVGIKIIKAGLTWWEIKDSLKDIWGILIGLALALSAVGIIYLIQSITTQSFIF
jgi:hypothetical protein